MHILIIVSSNSPEIKGNAVRFGNVLLEEGEDVTLFLNGPAVDLCAGGAEVFPLRQQAKIFALSEGALAA